MTTSKGKIKALCAAEKKGIQKRPVQNAEVREDFGIVGDAHAGPGDRQLSLLTDKSIDDVRRNGLTIEPGAFGENIIISGGAFESLKIDDRVLIGESVILKLTGFGKKCHDRCYIFETAGVCAMADKGIFARVIRGGQISVGDSIEVLND